MFGKLFGKLFGKKDSGAASGQEPSMIEAYDDQGERVLVERENYQRDILPGFFKSAWNDPDQLYSVIVMSLRDEFLTEILKPAKRLFKIDPDRERASAILGISLMKNNMLSEAEKILNAYLDNNESGVIMTNLAKVYSEQGDEKKSLNLLRKSLSVDPNQENALEWYGSIAFEERGRKGSMEAMHEIAEEPGSWRPQLWIARDFLENGDRDKAISIYSRVLKVDNLPPDVFMMISGDLGNHGHVEDIIKMILPLFDMQKHGISAGLNLIQACYQTGRRDEGLHLCDQIDQLGRYDLKETIEEWRNDLNAMK
jgi:tetratricopeptide (TPR) repeat protein